MDPIFGYPNLMELLLPQEKTHRCAEPEETTTCYSPSTVPVAWENDSSSSSSSFSSNPISTSTATEDTILKSVNQVVTLNKEELYWWSDQLMVCIGRDISRPCDRNQMHLPNRLCAKACRQGDCGLRKNNYNTSMCWS